MTRCDSRSISAADGARLLEDLIADLGVGEAGELFELHVAFLERAENFLDLRRQRLEVLGALGALGARRSPSVWASRLALASRSASCLEKSERMVACSRMMRSSSPCRRDSTARIWPPKRMSLTLSRLSGAASLGVADRRGARLARVAPASGRSRRGGSVLAMLGTLTSEKTEMNAAMAKVRAETPKGRSDRRLRAGPGSLFVVLTLDLVREIPFVGGQQVGAGEEAEVVAALFGVHDGNRVRRPGVHAAERHPERVSLERRPPPDRQGLPLSTLAPARHDAAAHHECPRTQ